MYVKLKEKKTSSVVKIMEILSSPKNINLLRCVFKLFIHKCLFEIKNMHPNHNENIPQILRFITALISM